MQKIHVGEVAKMFEEREQSVQTAKAFSQYNPALARQAY